MRSSTALLPLLLACSGLGLLSHCTLTVDLDGLTDNDVGGAPPATASSSSSGSGGGSGGSGGFGGGPPPVFEPLWAYAFGETGKESLFDVATGRADDVIAIVGTFNDTITFGPGQSHAAAGMDDGFLAVLDTDGNALYSFKAGGALRDVAKRVRFDRDGGLLVAGEFSSDFNLGSQTLSPGGSAETFVVKLNEDNTIAWVRQSLGSGPSAMPKATLNALAVDSSGAAYLGGVLDGDISFDGTGLPTFGGEDGFVVKYSRVGAVNTLERFGDGMDQSVTGLMMNDQDELFVVGSFEGRVDFNNGAFVQTTDGTSDIFVAKLDSSLTTEWVYAIHSTAQHQLGNIAADGQGGVLLTGQFSGILDAGGTQLLASPGDDLFLTRLDGDGMLVGHRRFGGPGRQYGKAIALSPDLGAYLGGNLQTGAGVDFGGGMLGPIDGDDAGNIFLVQFSSDGGVVRQGFWGDAALQTVAGVAVDDLGNVILGGTFQGSLAIGNGPTLTATESVSDVFVVKFAP